MVKEVLQNKWVRAVGLLGAILLIAGVLYLLSAVLVPLFFAFIVAYVFDPVIDWIETHKIKGRNVSRVAAIVTLVGSIVLASMLFPLFLFSSVVDQATEMMNSKTVQNAIPGPVAELLPDGEQQMSAPDSADTDTSGTEIPQTVALGTDTPNSETPDANSSGDESAIGGISALFEGPTVSEEEKEAASEFQKTVSEKLEAWLALDSLVKVLNLPGAEEDNPNAIAIIRQQIGKTVSQDSGTLLKSFFPQFKDAGTSLIKLLGLLGDTLLRSFLFIGNFVLFAFVAIYLLKDYDHIVAACDDLVPLRSRSRVRRIMASIDRQLRSFLRGQVTVCCCLGGMYAVGFLIAGAPFALLLAMLGALGSFVPYLGLILTIGPAVILTMLQYGPVNWHVGAVLATFAIAQFLEGNFLTPRIVGSQVGLGPVWVILAIMVFGSTLGFAGLLLAVPIAAVLKVLTGELLELYRSSDFFSGSAGVVEVVSEPKTSKERKTTGSSGGKGRRLKKV